jgi:hypothetical protein
VKIFSRKIVAVIASRCKEFSQRDNPGIYGDSFASLVITLSGERLSLLDWLNHHRSLIDTSAVYRLCNQYIYMEEGLQENQAERRPGLVGGGFLRVNGAGMPPENPPLRTNLCLQGGHRDGRLSAMCHVSGAVCHGSGARWKVSGFRGWWGSSSAFHLSEPG